MPRFTHLHTHSHYSLLDGLTKIDEMVDRAKELGMDSIALTDHGSMYGVVEFYKKAKSAGIKPIIGCEMYITDNMYDKRSDANGRAYYHLVVLATDNTGYKNLIKLVTASHLEGFYYKPRIDKNLLRQHAEGLIGLSACLGGELSRALISNNTEKADKLALEYQTIFGKGNYFIELQRHPNLEDQNIVTPRLIELARRLDIPVAATSDSHYCRPTDNHVHDVLLAVQTGNQVSDKDRLSLLNDDFSISSPEAMAEKFADLLEAVENTALIADRCNVELELGKNQLPRYPLPEGTDDKDYLRELCEKGLADRYGSEITQTIRERLDYELGVINKMGFASYFLIVQDYINWAKNNGIIVGPGRGSAAGSLVAYLLRITNMDPIKYNLLFERFLNPERISMPDIDVDFDDARRGDVFEYVRQKYGREHFAQIITFGTMAARGSVRDAGRALGLPYEFCDKVAKLVPFNPNQGKKKGQLQAAVEEVSELKQLYHTNPDVKKLIDVASRLEGVARHCSTHACAVVISPKPLTEYLPLQKGSNEGDIITQYEMHGVEDLGLLKMDFLGLSNLTIIEKTLGLIQKNHNVNIDIDALPLDDSKAFKLLQNAQTTGVFQLESGGMKKYLKELKPTDIEDIIAMVALYRPGPIALIPQYVARKHGKEKVEFLYPTLESVFKTTYGIMVYQEQLIEAVKVLAGFSRPEADVLRKAVGKKIKALLDEQEGKFKAGAERSGTPKHIADKFWELVEPFNRYAFNRSHAACYGLVAYQTAYLKAHYPVEFMTALLNSDSGDVERIAFLIEECRSMDIDVLPPDINESMEDFSVVTQGINKGKIRFGLTAIKNVGENIVREIIKERQAGGPYQNVENFVSRVKSKDLNKKSLESLIKAGATDHLGERGQLLASMEQLLGYAREQQKAAETKQASLFDNATALVEAPALKLADVDPVRRAERLLWEKELLGLYISDHPLKDYETRLAGDKDILKIKDVASSKRKTGLKIGGIVIRAQKILTKTGKPMVFAQLEDQTGKIEVVVFPTVYEQNQSAFNENNVLIVSGKIDDASGTPKLLCENVKSITIGV